MEEAKKVADEWAEYTQKDIKIEDETGELIAWRSWNGCLTGLEDMERPIQFGDFGYYSDWEEW